MFTDSRLILGLQRPVERHAYGYSLSNASFEMAGVLLPDAVDASMEPETVPNPQDSTGSADVAPTDIEPDSESDSCTSTAELSTLVSAADGSDDSHGLDRYWEADAPVWCTTPVRKICERVGLLRSAIEFCNKQILLRSFRKWHEVAQLQYIDSVTGARSHLWQMEHWPS